MKIKTKHGRAIDEERAKWETMRSARRPTSACSGVLEQGLCRGAGQYRSVHGDEARRAPDVPRDPCGPGVRISRVSRGVREDAIQALTTHSNRRTTQIYLDRGAEALTDGDYRAVTAPLRASDMLGGNGEDVFRPQLSPRGHFVRPLCWR